MIFKRFLGGLSLKISIDWWQDFYYYRREPVERA